MSESSPSPTRSSGYRVHLLGDPELSSRGVAHREGGQRALLPWSRIQHAIAAEVGEPEGVRTIVFDLVAREGDGWLAYRLDAEPGEAAMELAQSIEQGLGTECSSASLKSVATDGIPTRWYPDLESFEGEAIQLLEAGR